MVERKGDTALVLEEWGKLPAGGRRLAVKLTDRVVASKHRCGLGAVEPRRRSPDLAWQGWASPCGKADVAGISFLRRGGSYAIGEVVK